MAIETDAPIGIFDSGFGGLTVARAIVDQLPNEDILYLGDTERTPYGPRPLAQVREFALECLDYLVDQGVKALAIACNSASSAVLRDARERYNVPVIDVIIPAARRAVATTRNGRIGLICTDATATSGSYQDAFAISTAKLVTQPCPLFVPYVEKGMTSGPELERIARDYLATIQQAKCDTLILGCTHYPLLEGLISYVLDDGVTLVTSSEACAAETYRTLVRAGLTHNEPRKTSRRFLTTGDPVRFESLAQRLFSGWVSGVEGVTVPARHDA